MKLTVDKAGRITLPQNLLAAMRLGPGSRLDIEHDSDKITLRPVRRKAALAKEFGIWVCQGGRPDESILELIDRVRQERLPEFF